MSDEITFSGAVEYPELAAGLTSILNTEARRPGANLLEWGARIAEAIQSLLGGMELPPKEVVMSAVSAALDKAFAVIDVPGPDPIIEPLIKSAILAVVDRAYDALAKE